MTAHPIPAAALDDRLGFVGTAGSGKTYNAGGCVERLLASGARCVIVDPLDVWWGLRLRADGETPSVHRVVILGGRHGDLPLNEHAGAVVGETVARAAESFIVSLGGLGTKAAERRFMLAFLTALYHHLDGEPLHLVLDEADLWAPQRLLDKEGEAAKLLGQMEQIVRRGRIKGFIPWLITQRPAVLSKDVLSQVDGLVAFKLTSSQDRDAIGDWVQGQADKDEWKAIWSRLPTMQRGHGIVWVPGRGILAPAAFPPKKTFDSSATPKRGETRAAATLKPLDVDGLKGRLEVVAKEAVENDPRRLKARIAELERQLAAKATVDPAVVERARAEGFEAGRRQGQLDRDEEVRGIRAAVDAAVGYLAPLIKEEDGTRVIDVRRPAAPRTIEARPLHPGSASVLPKAPSSDKPIPDRRSPAPRSNGAAAPLPKGERIVLTAIAQHDRGVTREQLTVLTGYKRSSRDTYLQRLRERALIEVAGDTITATPAGRDALGPDFEPLPTGNELREHWLRELPEGERRVLEALVVAYPKPVDRNVLDSATGYKRSSRDTYLQRLIARRLVTTPGRGLVAAADELFG